jgi:hypothetical protein
MVCSSLLSNYLTLLERRWLVNVAAILNPPSLLFHGAADAAPDATLLQPGSSSSALQ